MKSDPRIPENLRIYAIGDIHGRQDLLVQLLQRIDAESAPDAVETRLVFLGDYIDRGHQVRDVIETLLALRASGRYQTAFIRGNHEMMLHDIIFHDNKDSIIPWLSLGGYETCLSYGVPLSQNLLLKAHAAEFITCLRDSIPFEHQRFLQELQPSVSAGDYFFCHAGVNPKVPLAQQSERDLAWIREKFIRYNKPLEKVIVHGHTIAEEPQVFPYRIGIDTGAYATGTLTALGLEGTKRWFLQT